MTSRYSITLTPARGPITQLEERATIRCERERDAGKTAGARLLPPWHYQGADKVRAKQVGTTTRSDFDFLQTRYIAVGNGIGNGSNQFGQRRRNTMVCRLIV